MKQNAPGKGLLKVVGILVIIFGVFGLVTGLLNLVVMGQISSGASAEAAAVRDMLAQMGVSEEAYRISVLLSFVQGVIYLVTGTLGVVFCNKVEKANISLACGGVLILYILGVSAYNAVMGAFSFTVIFSLILPLLYFWGALKNRQAMLEGSN